MQLWNMLTGLVSLGSASYVCLTYVNNFTSADLATAVDGNAEPKSAFGQKLQESPTMNVSESTRLIFSMAESLNSADYDTFLKAVQWFSKID